MFKDKKLAVVVPAYNDATQISDVLTTMPECVDRIVVVDDCSCDETVKIVEQIASRDARVHLIQHEVNQGVGGAIVTGYKYARDEEYEVTVVMAGDGQMDPADLQAIVTPVANGAADYVKANRFFSGHAFNRKKIPVVLQFGLFAMFMDMANKELRYQA